eukprot:scaffold3648_cov149-Amphora_coffeaeformis.AAC.7
MWNSLTSGLGVFAAKQQLSVVSGTFLTHSFALHLSTFLLADASPTTNSTEKTDRMRKELEEKRKDRGDDYVQRMAERKANKGKISQMWAENKAKNKS